MEVTEKYIYVPSSTLYRPIHILIHTYYTCILVVSALNKNLRPVGVRLGPRLAVPRLAVRVASRFARRASRCVALVVAVLLVVLVLCRAPPRRVAPYPASGRTASRRAVLRCAAPRSSSCVALVVAVLRRQALAKSISSRVVLRSPSPPAKSYEVPVPSRYHGRCPPDAALLRCLKRAASPGSSWQLHVSIASVAGRHCSSASLSSWLRYGA